MIYEYSKYLVFNYHKFTFEYFLGFVLIHQVYTHGSKNDPSMQA